MARKAFAALALLALFAGTVAANDACAPAFNWFPTATEIGEDVVINNKTCTGKQVCNFPAVWHQANQTTYMPQLSTSLAKGLLKVAFKQYGNQPPRLFFVPDSPFLTAGSDVTPCAVASQKPAATRKLLAGVKVVEAGSWTYSISYDNAPPATGIKIAGKSGELDPKKLNQDGAHCAEVKITIDGFRTSPAVATIPSKLETSQKICWFKVSTQATAKFDFDMCTNKKFTVNVSNIYPLAQNLSQNGTNVVVDGRQEMLFRPVIHLFGSKNRSLDGTVLKGLEYDSMNNPINYINKYIVLPKNFTYGDKLSYVLDKDDLDEGYYKLSAKIAMITQYPDLVELEGENRIVQADAYGEDVRGFTEFLGVTIINETSMVGVQKSKTTISQITSDRVGRAIQQGDSISFTWHFAGIGVEKCFHDNVELPKCSSPMKVTAKDVSSADTEHTFKVVFTDVCGNSKEADYAYTQKGVTPVSKVDFIPVTTSASSLTSSSKAAGAKATQNSAAGPKGIAAALGMALLLGLLL